MTDRGPCSLRSIIYTILWKNARITILKKCHLLLELELTKDVTCISNKNVWKRNGKSYKFPFTF